MNFFAHGLNDIDRPYLLAGTAVPDWLSAADRRVRMRPRLVEPFIGTSDPVTADVASGVMKHLDDDQWFHQSRAFVETSSAMAVAFREVLPADGGYRPGLLGHVATELILDGLLIERDPERLDRYYAALDTVDPEAVQAAANRMARRGPTTLLAPMIIRFREARFLADYLDPAGLVYRLNQVLLRIKLMPLADEAIGVIERGRDLIRPRIDELIGSSQPDHVETR